MDSLLYDVRAALRRLPKTPWFTLAIVATLAIAIGANTLIFSVVDGVLLRPLPFANPSRLVAVVNPTGHKSFGVSVPDFLDWRRQSSRLDALAEYGLGPATLTGRGTPERLNIAVVSANWFPLLGIAPGSGRLFTPGDDRPEAAKVIVVSDAFWRTRFGASPTLVGQTLTLDGGAYTVIGIAPPRFTYPSEPDIWLPDVLIPSDYAPNQRNLHFRTVIGRIAPGIALATAREEFRTITDRIKQQYPQAETDVDYTIEPLQTAIVGNTRPALLVLFGAVGCFLLIACANVTNLLLVRATGRSTEIALRIAIGAGRRRVIQELLVESVMLSLAGAAIGVLIAVNGIHFVVAAKLGGLPRLEDVTLSGRALLFTAIIATLTGSLFGLVPAYQASAVDLGETLKSATRGSSGHRKSGRTRGVLVVTETAIAAVLLIGAVLLTRSLIHMMDVDPGFQPAHVVAFDVNFYSDKYANWSRVREFTHAVRNRLLAIPGTRASAYGFGVPFAGYPDFPVTFEIQGRPTSKDDQPAAIYEPVSVGYFATMGVPIKEGREFTDDDRSHGHRVLVINEACARKYFPAGDAIGHHLILGGNADSTGHGDLVQMGGDIVGVVGDMKFDDLRTPAPPEIFQPHEQVSRAFLTFVVRTTSDPTQVLAAATRAVNAVDPDVPIFRTRSLAADVSGSLARPRLYATVVMTFGVVALLLAIIGIYGVLAYVVRERRRELGIRLALGARTGQVVRLVVGQGLRLTGLGLAIGLAIALVGSRVLGSLLFGVKPNDLATYEVVCGALLAVAALASWLPARSAGRIDPLIAMRSD
ncbi:MAG TPA: ABC transporter permease [Gemmatimonadaceae bacterium]|nr:ABC transporter permease [Gemmatimonadaceae bacterium]